MSRDELDREIAELSARLAKAPPVKENSAGKTLGSLLSLSAVSAATFQQQFFSAIVELEIAAALALPELLRPKQPPATHLAGVRNVASRQERTWNPDHAVTAAGFAARFQAGVKQALTDPEISQKLEEVGIVPVGSTAQEMASLMRRYTDEMTQLAKQAGIEPN